MRMTGLFLCIVGLLTWGGCRKTEVDAVSGKLTGHGGCKTALSVQAVETFVRSSQEECVEYSYDGQGILVLKHVNSAFNCCPGELHAEFSIQDNVICITERESAAQCHCICLYDLDYRLERLPARTYKLRIVNPYVNPPDAPLEVTIDLSCPTGGRHCQPRSAYPWNVD